MAVGSAQNDNSSNGIALKKTGDITPDGQDKAIKKSSTVTRAEGSAVRHQLGRYLKHKISTSPT